MKLFGNTFNMDDIAELDVITYGELVKVKTEELKQERALMDELEKGEHTDQ